MIINRIVRRTMGGAKPIPGKCGIVNNEWENI
jgi:hypothetical protein